MDIFLPLILVCGNACATPEDYGAFTGSLFPTEEACMEDLGFKGLPWVTSTYPNLSIVDIECKKFTVAGGDPA